MSAVQQERRLRTGFAQRALQLAAADVVNVDLEVDVGRDQERLIVACQADGNRREFQRDTLDALLAIDVVILPVTLTRDALVD